MSTTVRPYTTTIIVSGGEGIRDMSGVLMIKNAGGYLEQILVNAPGPGDTFDFRILDEDGYIAFGKDGSTGHISDITRIPVRGSYLLKILNASNNGTYNVKLWFKEEW